MTLIFIFARPNLRASHDEGCARGASLIVCHCKGISDRDIRAAVRCGASCRGSVAAHCAAGTGCGGCHRTIDEIIHAERASEGRSGAATVGRLAPSR